MDEKEIEKPRRYLVFTHNESRTSKYEYETKARLLRTNSEKAEMEWNQWKSSREHH